MRKLNRILLSLIISMIVFCRCGTIQADFVMVISVDGPSGPLTAGDIANFVFNVSFTSDVPAEFTDSIIFNFSNGMTTPTLTNDLTRFDVIDNFWIGGFNTTTGVGNFTANVGNEIFDSNSPKTVGTITLDTAGLASGNYDLFVQSTDWMVTGAADNSTLLFDGTSVAGAGNSITFPPILSFTITAVPEPSSLALVALITCFGCFARSRRWPANRSMHVPWPCCL